jgi:hypothetical protein
LIRREGRGGVGKDAGLALHVCAEPFNHGLPPADAHNLFVHCLREILSEREVLSDALPESEAAHITAPMERVRLLGLTERRDVYLTQHIQDQLNWYLGTLTASFLAWLQVKQHEELAHSYAVAAHELSFVREAGKLVHQEAELSSFVADAETAISRKHTLWLARRDHLKKSV